MFDYMTTLQQLTLATNAMGTLKSFIGAKNFVQSTEQQFISFRFAASNKMNFCKIKLDANDTYTVELGYIRGTNYTVKFKESDIYCDMLKDLFERKTGLFLSFN